MPEASCQNRTIPNPQIQRSRFLRRLHRFSSLNRADKVLIVETFCLSAFIALGFRLAGVPRTQAFLRRWSAGGLKQGSQAETQACIRDALRAQRMVKRATGLGGMCLARSLTLWTLLRRRGVETELRVGYRKREEKIEGHAWLEYEGFSINEGAAIIDTYTVSNRPVAFDAWRQIQSGDPF